MASLNFKGKSAVWNHHLSVPYHTLDKDSGSSVSGLNENENLIIEGDNLLALKALLPKYQGKVKCIYIDPPYNTGNEGWVYDDSVNNPIIKDWMGKVVGKEGEDLTRHDKWLCMMTPRLKLLRELLSDDGVIFVSIDNNEFSNLFTLMDEIFNYKNRVGNFIWRKKEGGGQTDDYFVTEHEFIAVYKKSDSFTWMDEVILDSGTSYTKEDGDGKYKAVKLEKWGTGSKREDRPTMYFPIKTPDGKNFYPVAPDGSEGRWRVGKKRMEYLLNKNLVEWSLGRDGESTPYEKVYFQEGDVKVIKERSIIFELAGTSEGTKQLTEIFNQKDVFDNPKPSLLIQFLLTHTSDTDSIILDSFAGSGTTAQAVLELNKEDGGNRKFILVQLPETLTAKAKAKSAGYDYVHEITRDRIKKVIELDKHDIGFTYYKLGPSIDGKNILEGKNLPTWENFAKYVHYLATGNPINEVKKPSTDWEIISKTKATGIYLIYKDSLDELKNFAITRDWLEIVKNKEGKKVVYAPACFLDKEILDEHNISFVQIPFNLFRRS